MNCATRGPQTLVPLRPLSCLWRFRAREVSKSRYTLLGDDREFLATVVSMSLSSFARGAPVERLAQRDRQPPATPVRMLGKSAAGAL
jgi:hypothetical protein